MKPKHLAFAIIFTSFAVFFTSCKKTDQKNSAEEIETTLELSADQAIADNLTEDANDVFMEAASDNNLLGQKPVGTSETLGILGCATVTVTPLSGFPKKILIDFGSGCTSSNGITRKGKISITLSDSVRKTGSIATLTFDSYFVNDFKKEGVITWTNNSTAQTKGWERKITDGRITAPTGKYWLHSGIKNVVQTEGYSTPRILIDDVYSISGSHTVTNANGVSRTSEIIEPLIKKTTCENISKGAIKMQGPRHYSVIDFGNGDCDKLATISIDGGTAHTFLLR